MTERMTPPRLPWWKTALFSALIVALVLVVVEAAAWTAGTLVFGERFSRAGLDARRRALDEGAGRGAGRPVWLEDEVLHPYLGFVPRPHLQGPLGLTEPLPTRPTGGRDEVVIAVIGGSVAHQFAGAGLPWVIEWLRALPAFSGRRFVVLNAAAGGYKQPQQLMTVAYLVALGQRMDLIINLDGFNDVALHPNEDAAAKVFPAYPRRWHQRVERALSRDEFRTMVRRLESEDRRRWYARKFSGVPLGTLSTTNLVYLVLDARLETQLAEADRTLLAAERRATPPLVATGPAVEFADDGQRFGFLVDLWRRSSHGIHELAAGGETRYYHFLQPSQYVPGSKPIGPEEARAAADRTAYRRAIETAYPLLREAGQALAAKGVRFHDLTRIFADHPEPLYVDGCCHVNERGNRIIAGRVFDVIRRDLAEAGPVGR
jgi:hypothetical protein